MRLVFGIGIAGLLFGCDGSKDGGDDTSSTDDTGSTTGSVSADVQAVFDASCTSCHSGDSAQSGLSLAEGDAYDATVDVAAGSNTYISCGDAAGSWVYTRMEDGSMPPGGGVSADDLATVGDWIDGGCQ